MHLEKNMVLRNSRSGCIRHTGKLLTNQSGRGMEGGDWSSMGGGDGSMGGCDGNGVGGQRKEINLYYTRIFMITHNHSDFHFW